MSDSLVLQESAPEELDVFISYDWYIQDVVLKLRDHLRRLGYRCWMDIERMGGGDELHKSIVDGLTRCKVVVACVTEKYTQSTPCNREISFADKKSKAIIPLLLEDIEWPPSTSMGFVLSDILYIDMRSSRHQLIEWRGRKVDDLRKQLEMKMSEADHSSACEHPATPPTPPGTPDIAPREEGVALKVLYNREHFSPVEGRPEIQGRGRYPGRSASYIDCRIPEFSGGLKPFEEVRDALSPLFQGQIGIITQLRGTVQGEVAAEINPRRDEEMTLYATAEGEEHSHAEMAESNQEQNITVGGHVFLCGGRRPLVLRIWPPETVIRRLWNYLLHLLTWRRP